jgi:hypothetical protein
VQNRYETYVGTGQGVLKAAPNELRYLLDVQFLKQIFDLFKFPPKCLVKSLATS